MLQFASPSLLRRGPQFRGPDHCGKRTGSATGNPRGAARTHSEFVRSKGARCPVWRGVGEIGLGLHRHGDVGESVCVGLRVSVSGVSRYV
eukprot:3330103-Rhodomonas_salina.1